MTVDFSLLGRVETILFLLVIATVSAIVLKKLKVPYTIGLVPVGIAVAYLLNSMPRLAEFRNLQLSQELIMYVLLPALIFDASVNIDAKLLRRNLYPTLMLAAPGLVIATVITGLAMYFLTPLGMGASMIFGALISATDPVAVISLFEMVGAPRRLRILVDGESLFNDATAIAMFNLVLKMVVAGTALSWSAVGSGAIDFCSTFFLGILVGAAFGFLMAQLMGAAGDDPHIQVALSIVLAYGTFLFADRVLHVSGVMAVLGAGVVTSYFGTTRFSERVHGYLHDFWAFMSFLANSAIFLLLGFTEENILFDFSGGATLRMVIVAILAIQVARAIVVYGICPFLGRGERKISLGYQTVMFWGGLRGAVPLALVFSLPADMPERLAIMQITLAVVLFTLLVQGLTTRRMMAFFRLDEPELFSRIAARFTLLRARRRGLEELQSLDSLQAFPLDSLATMENEYRDKIDSLRSELENSSHADPEERRALALLVWSRAAEMERGAYLRYFKCGLFSEKVYRRLLKLSASFIDDLDHFTLPTPEADTRRLARFRRSWRNHCVEIEAVRRRLPRFAFRTVRDEFAALLAIGIGVRQVQQELDTFREKTRPEVVACREFYEHRGTLIREELARLTALDADLVERSQRFGLRRMVLATELETIEGAVACGALPESEGEKLSALIRHNREGLDHAAPTAG